MVIPVEDKVNATSVSFSTNNLYGGGAPFNLVLDGYRLNAIGAQVPPYAGDIGKGSSA